MNAMHTKELTHEEFSACSSEPMEDVTARADAKVDIWPYVDALDLDGLGIPNVNEVHYVYRDGLGRYDQVLIGTGRFNALLVIVIDLAALAIHGHFLLNLNDVYGADRSHLRTVE